MKSNRDIAGALRELALFLEMDDVPFKPRAYEKAAYAVEAMDRPLAEVYASGGTKALASLPGIGKGIAQRIAELLDSGRISDLEEMRRRYPVDIQGLTAIEGLGPKMVRALYSELGVRNVEDLEKAAREGRIRRLPHFGEKSEQKILKGIAFLRQAAGRRPIGSVLDLVREIERRLAELPSVQKVAIAGSIRRCRETVGDCDLLVVSRRPESVMDFFASMPEVAHVYGKGPTKTMVRLANGLDADLRVVAAESFGAALNYFTGSKAHNVALRRLAQDRGWKLNEYGLFEGERRLAGRTEEEIYEALGLQYVPPELREDRGEIEAAREGRLPELIERGSLRGDLQIQTTWTDGAASIEDMVEAARALGLEYIAITDHTRSLAMTGGSDEKKLLEQVAYIEDLNRRLEGFRILTGAEVNILEDGSLDIEDEVLARLDVVGVAVHSHFHMPREQMTRRIIRAIENPHADILFHPTGRVLMKREPYDVDIDAVIEAARRTGTVLELDAFPDRLDLKDEHVHKAIQAGVPIVIDSDAHNPAHLRYPNDVGIGTARRGWATGRDVLNTLSCAELLARLKDGVRERPSPSRKTARARSKRR